MNNSRKIAPTVVFVALLSLGMGTAKAQNQTEMPTPPYVAAVPDFCAWTMTITPKDQAKPPAAPAPGQGAKALPLPLTVQKVVSTKTKDIKRDIIFYSNGIHSEVWYDKNYVIVRASSGEFQLLRPGSPDAAFYVSDMSALGFIGVDWITLGNFKRKTNLENGAEVYVYGGTSKFGSPYLPGPALDEHGQPIPPPQEENIPMKAMIAVDSHLPLVVEKDATILTYSYQSPPTEMLELPPDFQKAIAKTLERASYIEQMRKLEQR